MTITQDIDLVALMTPGDLGPACPYGITFSPDGEQVYVANYDANNLMILDATTRALQHKVNVGFSPTEVVVSPDGSTAYVLNSESESVSVIDASSGEVVATIPLATAWQVYLPTVFKRAWPGVVGSGFVVGASAPQERTEVRTTNMPPLSLAKDRGKWVRSRRFSAPRAH